MRYREEGVPTIVIAGKEYGSGSSRDWAAKGPNLLGVRAAIAESYERIHRSNLLMMGILPLQFLDGESRESLGLTGREEFSIIGVDNGDAEEVTVRADDKEFRARVRLDTPREREYLRHGGILHVRAAVRAPARSPLGSASELGARRILVAGSCGLTVGCVGEPRRRRRADAAAREGARLRVAHHRPATSPASTPTRCTRPSSRSRSRPRTRSAARAHEAIGCAIALTIRPEMRARRSPSCSERDGYVSDISLALRYRPELFGEPISAYFQEVMKRPSDWSEAERELFAAFVSSLNQCPF